VVLALVAITGFAKAPVRPTVPVRPKSVAPLGKLAQTLAMDASALTTTRLTLCKELSKYARND
jgi:hypothetical protein